MMKRDLKVEFFIVGIISAVIIVSALAINNFLKYKKEVETNERNELKQVEESVKNSLNILDKAYNLFDAQTTEEMKGNSSHIIDLYEKNKTINQAVLDDMSKEFHMDLYIIDEDNVIVQSSNNKDLGLDFSKCCPKLLPLLDERRQLGDFYSPGIDVEQVSGEVKKFSYEGTKDGKYIVELGKGLENDHVFDSFGFVQEINHIKERYDFLDHIRVLNIGGLALGDDQEKLSEKNREAFEYVLEHEETTELEDEAITYRYIFYDSPISEGRISKKIIEIGYNHNESKASINKSFKTLILQLSIILIGLVLIAFIIYYWISKQLYNARHDSLTGLYNRLSFDESLTKILQSHNNSALIMIDLDNFKQINDTLGHDEGDTALKMVASRLKQLFQNLPNKSAYRVGGDEFAIIIDGGNVKAIKKLSEDLRIELENLFKSVERYKSLNISASVGAFINTGNIVDKKEFYQRADEALYNAKNNGKNRSSILMSEHLYKEYN